MLFIVYALLLLSGCKISLKAHSLVFIYTLSIDLVAIVDKVNSFDLGTFKLSLYEYVIIY